jgi:hypothetical protein
MPPLRRLFRDLRARTAPGPRLGAPAESTQFRCGQSSQDVEAGPAVEDVDSGTADQHVVAAATEQGERPVYHPGSYGAYVLDPDG